MTAFRQITADVGGAGGSAGGAGEGRSYGRHVTSSSAESVSSVTDLTLVQRQQQDHPDQLGRSTPPTSLALTEAPCRPAVSLSDLAAPMTPVAMTARPQSNHQSFRCHPHQHPLQYHPSTDFHRSNNSIRSGGSGRHQHHQPRSSTSTSLHEITV